jgi:hypothetical protein
MELSRETHVSEPAVLDNSHCERSLSPVRPASPGRPTEAHYGQVHYTGKTPPAGVPCQCQSPGPGPGPAAMALGPGPPAGVTVPPARGVRLALALSHWQSRWQRHGHHDASPPAARTQASCLLKFKLPGYHVYDDAHWQVIRPLRLQAATVTVLIHSVTGNA